MKVEVFEHGDWRELEQVRRRVPVERSVVFPEKQQAYVITQYPPHRTNRLSQVREDINKIGLLIPYTTDWLNARLVVVPEQAPQPESLWELLFDLLFGWLADLKGNKKEK